ncbi:MAG: dipeptidase PepE [Armatimonadetes bacterium]|nr:dipeptidase PepE [Armatimonadota bacterium]
MKLLLLSNSKNYGMDYLEHVRPILADFCSGSELLFLPYAGVTISADEYTSRVAEKLPDYAVEGVHRQPDPVRAVREAKAIVVGGGNTFRLLGECRRLSLLEPLRERVRAGIPYIGWSAGSNLACPTIKTTNDMPIVDPGGLEALDLVPFQINPHYTDFHDEQHQGETREQRLEEFLILNPEVDVVGLREGSALRVEDGRVSLLGPQPARVFRQGREPRENPPGALRI